MNDCGQLNARATNLSTFELEQILEKQLAKLGLEHFVLMIIDPNQRPVFQHVCGFSDQQMRIYETNMEHDFYLQYYSNSGCLGRLVYLQEMLPIRKIKDPIFNEILIPTIQLCHSYCGISPIMEHHHLMLSSHSNKRLNYHANKEVQAIWRFVIAWGNYWVAQKAMSRELRHFQDSSQNTLTLSSLTSAEIVVLNMLAQGMDGSEVARRRNVSKETVRSQIKHILHKTACRHQNQLITRYLQSGVHYSAKLMTLSTRLTRLI